jgi:hypothetical protein
MKYEAQKVGNVESLGDIYRVDAPLDKQIEAFLDVGIIAPFLPTPEGIAKIRLDGSVDKTWSRTSIAPVTIKGGNLFLVKGSPLIQLSNGKPLMARAVVNAHRNGKYFKMGGEFYEVVEAQAKEDLDLEPEDRTVHKMSQRGDFDLTYEMDDSKFLLGEQRTPYFDKKVKNRRKGIIPFYGLSGDSINETTVNYLWFGVPAVESRFSARDQNLNNAIRSFAVSPSAEGSAKNLDGFLTRVRNANLEEVKSYFGEAGKVIAQPLTNKLLTRLREQ